MKNLIFASLGIILILILVFVFASSNNKDGEDVFIPEQNEIKSPTPIINNVNPNLPLKKTYNGPPPNLSNEEIGATTVKISTKKGDFSLKFFDEAPKAASNFIFLTKEGFYDGLSFHRREEGFVVQGGDPLGNGTGGPGYRFEDEEVTKDYVRGVLAMANAGPDTNGSQFFILLSDAPGLPKDYTIFGEVVEGLEVIDKIEKGTIMDKVEVTPN